MTMELMEDWLGSVWECQPGKKLRKKAMEAPGVARGRDSHII
jgi:hypothetical protein